MDRRLSDWRRWNPDGSDASVTVTLSVNPKNSMSIVYPSPCKPVDPNDPGQPHVFDPPSATKVANAGGWPEIEWKMVWINDGNADAFRVHVEDPLSVDLSFIEGTLECVARGNSVTDNNETGCYYDAATRKVIWNGTIAADEGQVTEATAENEVVITFRTSVPENINSVENQALAFWDHNGDGIIETDEQVNTDDPVTAPTDDPTKISKPCRPICQSGCNSGCTTGCPSTPISDTGSDAIPNTPIVVHNGQAIIDVTVAGESLVSFTQPNHGLVTIDDGGTANDSSDDILRYVPNVGYSGADAFTYTVINSTGEEITKTVLLNVEKQKSDSGDTLGKFSIILMIFLTGIVGLYYSRREEILLEEKERK